MTYIPTWAGLGYLAVVLDVFSRKVVGWVFGQRQTADLVVAALNMALFTRKPQGVIHHSDQGSQYTNGDLHVDRGLVRPPPPAQWPGPEVAGELREGAQDPSKRHRQRRHRRVTQRVLRTCGQAASGARQWPVALSTGKPAG